MGGSSSDAVLWGLHRFESHPSMAAMPKEILRKARKLHESSNHLSGRQTCWRNFDPYIERKGYENRSETIRDLSHQRMEQDRLEENWAEYTVARLCHVYNHRRREFARWLT